MLTPANEALAGFVCSEAVPSGDVLIIKYNYDQSSVLPLTWFLMQAMAFCKDATYQNIGDPLEGHDDCVRAVTFSPDGTKIVSGSNDKTIRIWNATTSAQIGDPIEGHDDWVYSVAFSPDGTRIVSGSHDKILRIWDATTGAQIGDPLEGHTDWVNPVAFSPDGARI
ncbi:WD40 repeat-like protein, partial [Gymnopus androsaceus JB14]